MIRRAWIIACVVPECHTTATFGWCTKQRAALQAEHDGWIALPWDWHLCPEHANRRAEFEEEQRRLLESALLPAMPQEQPEEL